MVVCAVKLCRNYTGKNIKPPEGISFHRFPTDADQKQEWITAIRREPDWVPGTHCRVCSVHFENSDFKISETGRRILHKDAVPTKNLYQEERSDTQYAVKKRLLKKRRPTRSKAAATPPDEESDGAVACRVCLATDTRLYNLHDCELVQPLGELTGCMVSPLDGLPQLICSLCCTLLQKCAEFRARCETSQVVLEEVRSSAEMVTTDIIRGIDRTLHRLTLPLTIKIQPILDLTEINIKQERLEDITLEEDSNIDSSHLIDDAYDIFDEKDEKFDDVKTENDDVTIDAIQGCIDDIYGTVIPKNEIFIAVDAKKILEKHSSKKRKSELKRKSKKLKKESVVKASKKNSKEDIRNTKARKTEEDYDNFAKMYSVDITFLTREEQIAEVQARKESDNYRLSKFKCDECFKGFTGEGAFKNHRAKHDPSIGAYACEPCGFRFPKRYKMLHHLTHHKMNFVCRLCGHVTKLPSKAKEHFKWHNGVKYPCHFCDKSFIKRTSQFNHMRNRHGSACCEICQQIFSGQRGLSAHMIKAHKEAVKSRCDSCGVQFHSEAALSRHVDTSPQNVCDPSTSACAQCGENFSNEELLNGHSKLYHWKEIKCEKCNANFENEKLYRMHRIVHKEFRERRPRSEPKPKGGKAARAKGKKVPKIQKRMCEMCGLTWRSSAALKYHQRVHTGEKPHQCPVCPKSFRIQDSLQIHMNTHTGARPFKCPHCPKAFKSRTQNHKHQLVHTKVRRYRCELCDKTFQTSTCVKTHIKTVHMKIPLPPRVRHRAPRPDPPTESPNMYMHNVNMKMDGGND